MRALRLYAFAVFLFLYLPILTLIVYSFNGASVGGFPPHDFTLHWYRILIGDFAMIRAIANSLIVAVSSTVIAIALGLGSALALDRVNFPGKGVFQRLVLLPLVLPGIITGLALLALFSSAGLQLSLLTVIVGHGTALIAAATVEISAGLQRFDRAQEEASLDLGASQWQTFLLITLPNLKLSLIGAALLVFTLSLDEIAVTFFLIGRENTLPLELWSRLRREVTPEINAVSTLVFLLSLASVIIWHRLRFATNAKGPES